MGDSRRVVFSWKAVVAWSVAALQLWSASAFAYDLGVTGSSRENAGAAPGGTSEYIYRIDSDEALITVYLFGAVGKQGLFHVPPKMDLITLITLAGGTTAGAEVSNILIKGQGPNSPHDRQIRFDLDHAIRSDESAKVPLLANDLVYIPTKTPVTQEILTGIALVSGILGIIVTGLLFAQLIKQH